MANKSGGASKTGQAVDYKNSKRWEKNRRRKLEKLIKLHPNNEQLKTALSSIVYRRKTPKVRFWSSTRRNIAGLFKRFTGRVDMNIFSNNEKVSVPALLTPGPYSKMKPPPFTEKGMFSIGSRVRYQ